MMSDKTIKDGKTKIAYCTIEIFERIEKSEIANSTLKFCRGVNEALKLSKINFKPERFEIRIQFRNRWFFYNFIQEMFFVVFRAGLLGTFRLLARGKSLYQSINFFKKHFSVIFFSCSAPNDSLFVLSFILALMMLT